VLGLLASACPRPEFSAAQFEVYQAKDFGDPMEEGVALYLHRINPTADIRNLGPRVAPDGKRYRPSLPLDLHFLVVPWARDGVKQLRLLGWLIRELENYPILTAAVLNQHGPEPDTFHPDESVDLIFENISIYDMNSIWGDLGQRNPQPSATYVARAVRIDSDIEVPDSGPVQTRAFRAGKVVLT
jgi:hypothetical protein